MVELIQGSAAVAEELEACEPLMSELDAPVTARRTWLTAALRCLPGRQWAVVDRSAGVPRGAVFLTVTRQRGYADVALLGSGVSDHARLLAADQDVAIRIAAGVRDLLDTVRGPWRLYLEQVPQGDPVLAALAGTLQHNVLTDGDPCPITVIGPDRDLGTHLSRNGRSTAKQGRNRLTRADPDWSIQRTRDPGEIDTQLPTLVELHRARDHAVGRRSDLDDPRRAAFFTAVTRALAEEKGLELATLRVHGKVAAYFLVLLDGGVRRFWNGRIDSAHGHLRVGRVLDVALLQDALDAPDVRAVDWMRGDLEHKRQAANDAVRTQKLTAWSSAVLRAAEGTARWGRDRIRATTSPSPRLDAEASV